jgi:arylsulfatase A-like enzyme
VPVDFSHCCRRLVSRQHEGRHMKRMLVVVATLLAVLSGTTSPEHAQVRRPNVVIILGDDLGYSDMGMFGSEFKTPNLDSLAKEGVRFTGFYTHATCSPTRSMLLSGVDTHVNGLGNMDEWAAPNQMGVPGYEGDLNDRVATLPELLKNAGYHTYMVGKWHLGKAPDKIPAARGFERDFSLLDGGGSYWDMMSFTALSPRSLFTEDGRYLTKLPKDYYATKTYTDKLISFIDANKGDGKPFFAYVAHQAPHDPFHLPNEWRDRHVGQYDRGWDALRKERLNRQVELGIMPKGTSLSERMWFLPDPIVLAPATRAVFGRKMELYAGMVENLDFHVGRLIAHLKEIGEYENTIFIVFGDNGAEGADLFGMIAGAPGLPVCGHELVEDRPEVVGRSGLVSLLRPGLGPGVHDAVQPVQGDDGGGRHPQCPDRQRPRRPAAEGQHQRRLHARGRHHAHAARGRRDDLSQDAQGA